MFITTNLFACLLCVVCVRHNGVTSNVERVRSSWSSRLNGLKELFDIYFPFVVWNRLSCSPKGLWDV